ncbi:PREDICTED: actin cytoskeleton-regulatory complex protein PAN1 isoform X6 [Bactrocera latifrons]|uniref:actin cytoskeleton-regulatory complex protein PAN1 isoform X6 n=1 Tax=Bactrocera latifrons TaxID=174628 RepID=UPI0008DE6C8F|nr:PREDICTED: actin cytoskeleton-regulatory complex protein PAN1 isoform X6 [Bactrocera latifrons]
MIGSFWNLCRACPSMPVDKQLHSEYRSTYRWHEFTGNSRPEVVRRAPAPNPSQFIASLTGPTNEPPLPRRKKCPELAYKSHEFIIGSEYTDTRGGHAGANRLARSEERGTPSRRSKSEGPPAVPNGRAYAIPEEVDGPAKKQAGESNGLFKKTISKLSTEYRLQFVWPNVRRIKGIESGDAADHPRKSISMGALKASQQQQQQQQQLHLRQHPQPAMPTVHKKRTTNQKEATLHELEPLVSDAEESKPQEKQVTIVEKVERKMTIRPFSQAFDQERTNHFITKKENFGFDEIKGGVGVDNKQQQQPEQEVLLNGTAPPRSQPNLDLWFKEVVELRKKAGEYKCRGWGIEIDPELYKKQKDLWEQVSKRSSLSALSLASSVHRPITKEEKEQENNKKSIPLSKATQKTRVPGHAHLLDNKDEISALPARFNNIRHHLERTTGPDVEEGALLPSPTREKLMPAITKRESESQRGSPKKTAASRHGSPQKGSPQKGSPKKVIKTRSQSVGPAEHVSPKRQLRSASTAPSARLTAGKKTPVVPQHATSAGTAASGTALERKPRPYDAEDGRDTAISVSSCSPQPAPEIPDEPIVKSPPEPTRVKSPEQILMRSPDPVNWTVPLDTGKTFTVTQNVKEGENYSRPQSEIKASTPVEKPPPPPQSAPPQLTEQAKMDAWKHAEPKMGTTSPTGTVGAGRSIVATQPTAGAGGLPSPPPSLASTAIATGKPVPGSTLRCLDDPIFDVDIGHLGGGGGGVSAGGGGNTSSSSTSTTTAVTARTTANDVLEKARDRFDRFWGGSKEEHV